MLNLRSLLLETLFSTVLLLLPLTFYGTLWNPIIPRSTHDPNLLTKVFFEVEVTGKSPAWSGGWIPTNSLFSIKGIGVYGSGTVSVDSFLPLFILPTVKLLSQSCWCQLFAIWSKIIYLCVVSLLIGHFLFWLFSPQRLIPGRQVSSSPHSTHILTRFWLVKSSSESPGPCLLRGQMQILMVKCICCFQNC